MNSIGAFITTVAWAVASAIGVVIIGLASLSGGRSRPRGAFAFGLFCVLWGVQIALLALAGILPPSAAAIAFLLATCCLLASPYLLIEVAASQSLHERGRLWPALRLAFAAWGGAGALVLIFAPSLIFQGVFVQGGASFAARGPLDLAFTFVPHFVAFAIALVTLARAVRASPTTRTADRVAVLLGGLGLYVGFAAGNNFAFYLTSAWLGRFNGNVAVLLLLFTGLLATALTVALGELRATRHARSPAEARRARLLALAILAPLAWGALEGFVIPALLPQYENFESVGLWRLAGVGVIAFGFARWRVYDLPQRAARVAATASGATAAAAGGAAAYGATTLTSDSSVVPALAGLVVLAAILMPSVRFARRLFGFEDAHAHAPALAEELYGQRIDSYRAALEASLARGTLDEDYDFLAALRQRFDITDAEERVLLHYAKTSVLVPRSPTDKRHAFDAYERLRLLGEGGGGRTWLARDRARERLVVLKEPLDRHQADEKVREAVLREARLAARIRHANVVSVEDVVEDKAAPLIVMEYLEGGSLADLLRARGTLPWREAVDITLDVLRGLEAVHAAGIVHRDIKPSNVLLTSEGVPKIADFGIAVTLTSGKTMVEGSTTFAGTLSYVAPEIRAGSAAPDKRADVYSAGALLHELVYGAPPNAGRATVIVQQAVPAALTAALARALSERPDERPPTAKAFAEELLKVPRTGTSG